MRIGEVIHHPCMSTPVANAADTRNAAAPPAKRRKRVRAAIAFALALMILVPFVSCVDQGQIPMSRWLKQQDAVARARVYCRPYMETGCGLEAEVTLVPDTNATDAAAVIDGALEKAMEDRHVTADYFSIELEWQYRSASLNHYGVSVYPRTTSDDKLTEPVRARRVELIGTAIGLAEGGAESVTIGSNSLDVKRGEVDAVPTDLLATTSFSDNAATVGLKDRFTLDGWEVQIESTADNQPLLDAIDRVTAIPPASGTEPRLTLDATNTYPGNELQPTIDVRGLPLGDEDTPALDHAAPILAAIDGTQGFTDVTLCTAAGAANGVSGYSCVFYDMHDGKVDRDSGYPRIQARDIYDAAQRL